MSDAYDKVYYHGKLMDQITKAAIQEMERRLGYELTIVQGSYNTSVSASAGTHSGSGAFDLAPWDQENKVKVGREVGVAIWHRPELWQHGKRIWGEHCHGIVIGDEKASPSAKRQVTDYQNGLDGLAGRGPDTGPKVPFHPFVYPVVSDLTRGGTVDDAIALLTTSLTRDQSPRRRDAIDKALNLLLGLKQWPRKKKK